MSHGNNNIYLSKTISQRLCLHDFSVLVAATVTVPAQRREKKIKLKLNKQIAYPILYSTWL